MKKLAVIILALACSFVCRAGEDVNVTPSPDASMEAFTRDNNLWVRNVKSGVETQLTFDGTDLILNGYASWVYYEEILGRPSRYRAFWWSPDSRRIGFYRFDNSEVPMFPIYSPFGQYGSLSLTRYPKAGDRNPEVRIGMIDLSEPSEIVWADFDWSEDQYFGIPFWGKDSREFYIAREPRRQSRLDLYAVNAEDGSKRLVYHEEYPTWLNWIEEVIFTDNGLYMARSFETGWEQIYFLSYDGKTFKRLTSGENWDISLLKVDEKKGDVWFMAKRDSRLHPALYKVDRKGNVKAFTDPAYYARNVKFSEDGKTFTAEISTACVPWKTVQGRTDGKVPAVVISDTAGDYNLAVLPKVKPIQIKNDGFDLYGLISYPKNFNRYLEYPVMINLYGGPGNPAVRDSWGVHGGMCGWCYENDVIYMVVDPRSSGENGHAGMDEAFRQITVTELQDYVAWARYMQTFPYVKADRIGVEGFSFGGTTTAMLVMRYPEYFHCGIAGGGVYDWRLYDSHYTERFMDTPQANPDGYARATVLNFAADSKLPVAKSGSYSTEDGPVGYLKLTHGTGDDNVHFQNTLQLMDSLQKAGRQFDFMIYPDGGHGYRGYQHNHDVADANDFWKRYLLK